MLFDGKKYLTISALSKLDKIALKHANTIEKIIKKHCIQGIKGKDKVNKRCNFYPIEEIKKYTND